MRRAKAYEKLEKYEEASKDYTYVLERDRRISEAGEALQRLPKLIEERNERMKTEMMTKLKDLGNVILKPFGYSTDNFQFQQDPNTGSYNVKFDGNK